MGVAVDEAGRDDEAARVDLLGRGAIELPDCDDVPVLDADVALEPFSARAVDNRAAGNLEVKFHAPSPLRVMGLYFSCQGGPYEVQLILFGIFSRTANVIRMLPAA